VVSVQARIEANGRSFVLGAPALIGGSGEAAGIFQ
jgi:hypothetical protein